MKTIIALGLFLAVSAPLYAGYNADMYGSYLEAGKSADMMGGGAGIGISIIDNLSLRYRGMYAVSSRKTEYFTKYFFSGSLRYNHMTHLAGLEYVLSIPVIRIGWRASIMAGYSESRIDMVELDRNVLESIISSSALPGFINFMNFWKIRHKRDAGASIALWTGLQYDVLPFFAPFIDVGLHKSFYYRDLSDTDVIGVTVLFGVRFAAATDAPDY